MHFDNYQTIKIEIKDDSYNAVIDDRLTDLLAERLAPLIGILIPKIIKRISTENYK